MMEPRGWQWVRPLAEGIGVVAVLLLVVSVTYLPHMVSSDHEREEDPWTRLVGVYSEWSSGERDDYEYPIHVDTQVHWGHTAQMMREDSLRHADIYTDEGGGTVPLSLRGLIHERGYWIGLQSFVELTGVDWFALIRFLPALWMGATAALVWGALRPWPGALIAAGSMALVPTSLRFLGPAFMVPIGFGMAWLALGLLLARRAGTDRSALVLLLVAGVWAFFIHLLVGFAYVLLVLTLLPSYIGVSGGTQRRNGGLALLGLLIPLAWLYDAFESDVQHEATKFGQLPLDFTIFDQLGIGMLAAWGLGTALVFARPPQGSLRPVIVGATLSSLAIFGMIVINVAFDILRYALYDRWHQPFAVFATVPVAYGITAVAGLLPVAWRHVCERLGFVGRPAGPGLAKPAAVFLALTLALLVWSPGVTGHLNERHYQILDNQGLDHSAMQAGADLDTPDLKFLSHPWKAPVYSAMTGRSPLTWLSPGSPPINGAEYHAYRSGSYDDPLWMLEREITVVVDRQAPTAELYQEVAPGLYVLDPEIAAQLEEIQRIRNRGR